MEFSCVLPYPPSVNHYWRGYLCPKTGTVRFAAKAAGKKYRQTAGATLLVGKAAERARGETVFPFNRPLSCTIVVNPPDKRRRDLDNVMKAILDVLQWSNVIKDDALIQTLTISRASPMTLGRVLLALRDL